MESILAPSILAGNHANLAESAAIIESTPGLKWVHLDIMDGHFVPNLTFGPQTVQDLRTSSKLFFDTHLMLSNPQDHVEAFIKAGSQNVTIHIEPDYDISGTLAKIRSLGSQAGICLNPDTPASEIEPYLDQVDLVLVMTVQPGFGGQSFRQDMMPKLAQINQWRLERGYQWRLEVDGGVNQTTALECRNNGCDTFVAGTAFFKAADRADFAANIQEN